ncbi:hypothetical protein S40285_06966 [Stachybotrys chlorohalonatus IBT 40285]|uniref:SH3 domain-containing protein n=1 Tax=Stachybotrys chlorohalonatus (strain IBT 40285) TaxID=1283841 RepID=A0A084QV31_STAC4|nr:hypothetical protein S40285_06966 [Stachybotrys chlorohalonata IBT 40285]
MKRSLWAMLAASPLLASAQATGACVSLEGSSECSEFGSAAVSTDQAMINMFSFLRFVTDLESFDSRLSSYVAAEYVQERFQGRFQCGDVNFEQTDYYYARFTKSVLCNAMIQNSIQRCGLSAEDSRPLCAGDCADFAQSEAFITSNRSLCTDPAADLTALIRSDYVTCSQPDDSLSGSVCLSAIDNEDANCGYGSNLSGLCSYCAEGGINSTETCCYNSNAEERCQGVDLPVITSTMVFLMPTATSEPTTSAAPSDDNNGTDNEGGGGLSGGAIAGIVVGVVAGIALLAVLLFFCLRRNRHRGGSQQGSIFNQPSPARKGPAMAQSKQTNQQGYEVLPGGRIARMSALEGHTGDTSSHRHGPSTASAATGAVAGYMVGRKAGDRSSSSDFGDSVVSDHRGGMSRNPPATSRRNGSLSSSSVLGGSVPQSPTTGGYSSPQGVASQQSEQLPFFKDYYSQDDIHPSDKVSVLWAYQPRAPDEFALERGDMLKIVGIWDDGWATGVMVEERADEWEARRQAQRDSGVSNTSGRRESPTVTTGEIKAFPLVCVCLPEHWKKTIEGDGSTETGSSAHLG